MQMNDEEERHAVLAVRTKLPVAVNDAFNDERFDREHLRKWGVRSVLVVPLILRGEARGVIFFNYQQSQHVFTDYEIDFAVKLSASLSLALESARLLNDLQAELAQRKRAQEQLRELSQRLTYHVDNSPLAVIEWGPDMRLIRWSGAAERMFGWKAEEVLGKRIEDFRWVYDEDAQQVRGVSADLQTGADPQRFSANRNHCKDGSVAYCEWYNSSLVDESGNLRSILSLVLDVTERKRAEEALQENERQLQLLNESLEQKVQEKTAQVRRLASDVIKAEQGERHRIARILHDDLQQRAYAIQMQLALLRDQLQGENKIAENEIADVERQLKEIVKVTRQLSINLSPPILPDEGLSHAIHWLAAQMRQQYGLAIEVQAEDPFAISDEQLHVLLFNCVRELLFNVVKHARASQAAVTLQWSGDDLRIEVHDNGRGFSSTTSEQEEGEEEDEPSTFGLATIRHQLSLFDGQIEMYSEPGKGTRVILTVPVAEHRR
jgi:PAS domain S-box-containing protein